MLSDQTSESRLDQKTLTMERIRTYPQSPTNGRWAWVVGTVFLKKNNLNLTYPQDPWISFFGDAVLANTLFFRRNEEGQFV